MLNFNEFNVINTCETSLALCEISKHNYKDRIYNSKNADQTRPKQTNFGGKYQANESMKMKISKAVICGLR